MCRGFVAAMSDVLQPFPRVAQWEARMRALGHGQRTEMEASDALALARDSSPLPPRGIDTVDPLDLARGTRVSVTPDDYGKVPVIGELVTLRHDEIAVRRNDPGAGEVVVHFPRIGYSVEHVA
jgi:hypothetical protein